MLEQFLFADPARQSSCYDEQFLSGTNIKAGKEMTWVFAASLIFIQILKLSTMTNIPHILELTRKRREVESQRDKVWMLRRPAGRI